MKYDLESKKSFVQMWEEINNHPAFGQNVDVNFQSPHFLIDPVMVNCNDVRSKNEDENIFLRYWYEIIIPYRKNQEEKDETHDQSDIGWRHDGELDGGAVTYEDAIISIHKKLTEKYGPYFDRFKDVSIEEILGIKGE